MKTNGLPKIEHLTGETRITALYATGKAFICYPFRIVYRVHDQTTPPIKVLFSVPKKRHKHAVTRNTYKRQMREAYRCNKQQVEALVKDKTISLEVAISVVSNDTYDSNYINTRFVKLLDKLAQAIQ